MRTIPPMLILLAGLAGCATAPDRPEPVVLEFRSGSLVPGLGLTAMEVVGSGHTVYLADEVLLANRDVESARVVSQSGRPQIEVVFTEEGAKKLAQATEAHLQQPIGIVIDGQLVSAPIVRARIAGGRALIAGAFSEPEARRLADGISSR